MIDIETFAGPLDDSGLESVGSLYGRVDPKYLQLAYLRHLFIENPYGWALHAFARDGDEVIGHCSVIPVRARVGGRTADSGKVEAYVVDERYRRSRERGGERPVALDLLWAVSDAAAERGIDPLHAYVTPHVGAIFERAGYRAQTTSARPYVLATSSPRRDVLRRALVVGQSVPLTVVGAVGRGIAGTGPMQSEAATGADSKLVEPSNMDRSWTIAGNDSWDWFLASGSIRALELPGRRGIRALVLTEAEAEQVQLLAWRPSRPGLASAVALLAALAEFAKEGSARTVRIQPWPSKEGDGALVRACRLMGFIPRSPFTVYVRSARAIVEPVSPSPFFYATF